MLAQDIDKLEAYPTFVARRRLGGKRSWKGETDDDHST